MHFAYNDISDTCKDTILNVGAVPRCRLRNPLLQRAIQTCCDLERKHIETAGWLRCAERFAKREEIWSIRAGGGAQSQKMSLCWKSRKHRSTLNAPQAEKVSFLTHSKTIKAIKNLNEFETVGSVVRFNFCLKVWKRYTRWKRRLENRFLYLKYFEIKLNIKKIQTDVDDELWNLMDQMDGTSERFPLVSFLLCPTWAWIKTQSEKEQARERERGDEVWYELWTRVRFRLNITSYIQLQRIMNSSNEGGRINERKHDDWGAFVTACIIL